jgi:hypothetical protein
MSASFSLIDKFLKFKHSKRFGKSVEQAHGDMCEDDDMLKKFKQLVIAKRSTLRGRLGVVLSEASRVWISREVRRRRIGCEGIVFEHIHV